MVVIVDDASSEVWSTPPSGMDRFAPDLLRDVCGSALGPSSGPSLALGHDGGPCFRSEHYQAEIGHLGIARSPAFRYEPETNGCAEKSSQTPRRRCCGSSPSRP